MGLKTIQSLESLAGVAPTYAAAAADDYIVPSSTDDKLIIHLKNGHTAAQSITIDDVNSVAPVGAISFDADVTVSIPNASERMIELTQLQRFKNAQGEIHFNFSGVTALTVGIFRLR